MTQAIRRWDTLDASTAATEAGSMMGHMTLMAVPEYQSDHEEPSWLAAVRYLPDPFTPTPEEVAAKKARRRLDGMEQDVDRHGVSRPHFFNAAGYDVYGYNRRGEFDPSQKMTDAPNPFPHS